MHTGLGLGGDQNREHNPVFPCSTQTSIIELSLLSPRSCIGRKLESGTGAGNLSHTLKCGLLISLTAGPGACSLPGNSWLNARHLTVMLQRLWGILPPPRDALFLFLGNCLNGGRFLYSHQGLSWLEACLQFCKPQLLFDSPLFLGRGLSELLFLGELQTIIFVP